MTHRFEFIYYHAARGRLSIVANGETEAKAERHARRFFYDRCGFWPNRPIEAIDLGAVPDPNQTALPLHS